MVLLSGIHPLPGVRAQQFLKPVAVSQAERPPIPPPGVPANVGSDIRDFVRARGTCAAEQGSGDVDSDHLRPQPRQMAAHPALAAGHVQDLFTGHGGHQAGVRRD
jgi:hypothetical protein